MAVHVLGWSANALAVAPLILRLTDDDRGVRSEAAAALSRLDGTEPGIPGGTLVLSPAEWAKLLGPNGEKLDAEKAIRHVDPEPGIYRLGV